jgi:putative nucleotidyltransferase with HDIG domain
MTRTEAWTIVCEFIQSEALRRHSLAVETCVSAYAAKFGADGVALDPEAWTVTALLHDFDWEIHPQAPDHPMKGEAILRERGVTDEIRRAILSHASYSGVPRESLLEKTLFACDELAGFLTAISYVKPSKSILEVEVKSVRKKMKDKAFARAVNRDDIISGALELGVDLDVHIDFCIQALQARAAELGLSGGVSAADEGNSNF